VCNNQGVIAFVSSIQARDHSMNLGVKADSFENDGKRSATAELSAFSELAPAC